MHLGLELAYFIVEGQIFFKKNKFNFDKVILKDSILPKVLEILLMKLII